MDVEERRRQTRLEAGPHEEPPAKAHEGRA